MFETKIFNLSHDFFKCNKKIYIERNFELLTLETIAMI